VTRDPTGNPASPGPGAARVTDPREHEVALLGGSFNPPHVGHLMAALYVRACVGSDEVWLVPTFHHPFGKETVAYEHRVAMCEIAARELGPWLKVSRAEADVHGEGRTIELLEHLMAKHPGTKFRLVIGSDILADLPKWKAWDRIQQLAAVTVLHRAGHPAAGALGPPLAEVSSTGIRRRLAAGDAPADLVPRAVLDYATKENLFR
jgi:nicotinate-nucleotide adenylyltransferase